MNSEQYFQFCRLRSYNSNIVKKFNDNAFMLKFNDAFDRMLYCKVRGLEEEHQQLLTKIVSKIKEYSEVWYDVNTMFKLSTVYI